MRYGNDAIVAADLLDQQNLVRKLTLMRDRFLLEMQQFPHLEPETSSLLHATLPLDEADLLRLVSEKLELSRRMPNSDTVIFEGAQGVLLDEWHGFHPYTTWSTVTPQHAFEMLAEYPAVETSVLGITRAFATRHGAGPFPTSCSKMSAEMIDRGNPQNDWQGAIRFGPLDLVLTEYAARISKVDSIVVNCLDQLPAQPRIATAYNNLDRLPIPSSLRQQEQLTELLESAVPHETAATENGIIDSLSQIAPVIGTGYGPSHLDREIKNKLLA